MNNEELLAKYKALFPDNVEAIVVRKDDYDRLYGDLTKENIELKQEIERLNKCIKDDKENANEIMAEQQQEIERLHSIIKEVREYIESIEKVDCRYFDYNRALKEMLISYENLKKKVEEDGTLDGHFIEINKLKLLEILDKENI